MSDHDAKSRSIKELKAKKHHEKLSLLRASVKRDSKQRKDEAPIRDPFWILCPG